MSYDMSQAKFFQYAKWAVWRKLGDFLLSENSMDFLESIDSTDFFTHKIP